MCLSLNSEPPAALARLRVATYTGAFMLSLKKEIQRRRTFAIISHPDAGKTTLTEKLLLYGGAIQLAGTVKGRKASRHATSDWMELEKQRGISVTSSVMQFPYGDCIINLLDTPGHADFSEDTYRTLTAVDSALMVIDGAKGVEARTIELMKVCRLRDTPIFTYVNKLDREGREPIELLDEIESVLQIEAAPVTWPIGMGSRFAGVYHLYEDRIRVFEPGSGERARHGRDLTGLHSPEVEALLGSRADELRADIELVRGASHRFDLAAYLAGRQTPVYFGSAINNFGITDLLDDFVRHAPPPLHRPTETRQVAPEETAFTGFVFKIQANTDPAHRDRIAFLRICSGVYQKGIKLKQVRTGKEVKLASALTFMAADREHVEEAFPGDIIGIHNHGTIGIGDTFTEGEDLKFTGIPYFAPSLFRRARLRDPLRVKALHKGLAQLCEEGATQLFRPVLNNDLVLGAVGILQFDVVAHRLQHEYGVESSFEPITVTTARWVTGDDPKKLDEFRAREADRLALDASGALVYLAPNQVLLNLTQERWPGLRFAETREH